MPIICRDQELSDRIHQVCERFSDYVAPVAFEDADRALEFLRYELPEISVINYSDPEIDTDRIIDTIKADPWLHYGGLIVVHSRRDAQRAADQMPNSNIISLIPRGQFVSSFFRVLRIVIQNSQILYQRDLQSTLTGSIAGTFVMDNDPFNVRAYANLVSNFLYNSNFIDQDGKDRLHVAIFEMLMNAVEHGNCDISYAEKTQWLETRGDILDLIRRKTRDPEIRAKRVYFSYRITPERSYFTIRDQGSGFDWRAQLEKRKQGVNLGLHGHGIQMTGHYMENLAYNEAGNEVSFEFSHQPVKSNIIPGIFVNQEERVFHDGETVFTEGEESNNLYYIVAGKMHVYHRNERLSTLTASDIFLGEMSFLLNDRRSATVVSDGTCRLLPISKNDFINAVKANPHYGIFLARLLAKRLSRLNQTVVDLRGAVGSSFIGGA
ncbi:MAG: cyclic nucleotide-binding domain-containing protein [Spirochaetaceae bacterium]